MIGISLSYRFNRGKEIKKSQNENRIEESKRIGLCIKVKIATNELKVRMD